jgi:hypothetical protein
MRAAANLTNLTLGDLRRALDQKERELRSMLARKEELSVELEELGETLEAMLAGSPAAQGRRGGAAKAARAERKPAPTNGRRKARGGGAPREGTLPVAIRSVLERVVGPMRVGEIADAVTKAGYASKSKNLGIIVANRLAQMDDVEKVDRGLYQLRRDGGGQLRRDGGREDAKSDESAKSAAGG